MFLILVYLNLLNLVIKCSISGKSDYVFFSDNKRLHVSWLNSNRPHAIQGTEFLNSDGHQLLCLGKVHWKYHDNTKPGA